MKKVLSLIIALLMTFSMTFCLSACGKKEFKVSYVGVKMDVLGGFDYNSLCITGPYNGVVEKLNIDKAFKDCTLEDCSIKEGDKFEYKTTQDLYCEVVGGVTLTLKDADGKTHEVKVDKDSVFELDDSGEEIQLILPKDE